MGRIDISEKLMLGMVEGVLVDIETTGLNPVEDEIITLGYIMRDRLRIYQRSEETKEEFYGNLKSIIDNFSKPMFGYNIRFEIDFFREQLKANRRGVDIFEPWKIWADESGLKWPKLDELVPRPLQYYNADNISSGDIPGIWGQYIEDGKQDHLKKIVDHNKEDLLRELYLLLQYPDVDEHKPKEGKEYQSTPTEIPMTE